jgi:PhzF family phenazine biosynthesis protein
MSRPIWLVDAFTSRPFGGNPAGVCLLQEQREAAWMQGVASDMNQAETAFVRPLEDGFDLRWFTPAIEIDLCGHATLASAHVLWETGALGPNSPARFHTRSGVLTAARKGDWIELDFPATPEEQVEAPLGLAEALGIEPRYVGKSRFDYLVEVDGEESVLKLEPDFGRLRTIPCRGVIVTSLAQNSDCDFVSRFFAPAAGINEDPVTGSSHCCLGPFWGRRLARDAFVARQLSPRGGLVKVHLEGSRVFLGGQAVTVLKGELLA